MPIYAYKCTSCGHAEDVLQKMSAAPLTTCPACHKEAYAKQVTAAGFQLKGSGWYVTDFRNKDSGGKASTSATPTASSSGDATASQAHTSATTETTHASSHANAVTAASPTPTPAPTAKPPASST